MRLNLFLVALLGLTPLAFSQVTLSRAGDRVRVDVSGKPFTQVIFDARNNKPYLYPLRSASGKAVTRHYPVEAAPGESHDHPHHRGLAFTHGDVNGFDFWSSDPSEKSPHQGRILLDSIDRVESGSRSGTLIYRCRWVEPDGKRVLTERRTMVFYSNPTLRIIDFDIELTPAAGAVRFGDTKEAGFYIRLATGLTEDHGGTIVVSTGKRSEAKVWGTRADWIDDYGTVDAEQLGVAIFDHPSNPRHPTYWHARAYGLISANIFGLGEFLNDKTQDGSLTLAPGKKLRFRYRVIVHPGDTVSARVGELYREYTGLPSGEGTKR